MMLIKRSKQNWDYYYYYYHYYYYCYHCYYYYHYYYYFDELLGMLGINNKPCQLKGASTDMRYFARSKLSMSLVHKKILG